MINSHGKKAFAQRYGMVLYFYKDKLENIVINLVNNSLSFYLYQISKVLKQLFSTASLSKVEVSDKIIFMYNKSNYLLLDSYQKTRKTIT